MGSNPALRQIAEVRNCSVEEARWFCIEVQARVDGASPSFKSIARGATLLGAEAHTKDVAEEAVRIHAQELAQRPPRSPRSRSRRRRRHIQPSPLPEYIIVDGVVQSFRGWQKREGITKDE